MSTGNFSASFELGQLAAHLDAGTLLLTPNQRLARVIKAAWDRRQAEKGLSAWHPATVKPLEYWLREQWEAAVTRGACPPRARLSGAQAREIWLRVISADRASNGDYTLLQTTAAGDMAAAARDSLLHAGIDWERPAVRNEFQLDNDCGTFYRWLRAFDAELEAAGQVTASDCLRALLEATDAARCEQILLVDIDSVTPLQQACLERFCATPGKVSSGGQPAPVHCSSYPDRSAELRAIAQWAADSHSTAPQRRLGIVLRDMQGDRGRLEYELRRAFGHFGDDYTALPVNFSTALRLDQVPVVRDALRMLACCQRRISLADLLGLLRTRFCTVEFARDTDIARLIEKVFADAQEQVELSRLRFLARKPADSEAMPDQATLATILGALQSLRLHTRRQLPSAWAESFGSALQAWGWPGPGYLDSLEYQQVEHWYQVLDDYSAMDSICGELGLDEALSLLQRCCRAKLSQPKTPDHPVQVLGPLEAAGLQFDALWVCGLEGSAWPEPARPNPFIPQRMQRQHRMPHASSEQQWDYASGLWRQYRQGCRELFASHARQLDNAPQLPSPILQQYAIAEDNSDTPAPEPWRLALAAAEVESVADDTAPPVADSHAPLRGGSAILRDQAACPFRAWARRRLGLQELGQPSAGLSAADRGKLLHDALEVLWHTLQGSRQLASLSDQERAQAIETAVQQAMDAVPDSLRILVGMHCLSLEGRRLNSLLQEWIELELQRGDFLVEASEVQCKLTLQGRELSLRVDRVDRLPDGRSIVIDYKSGKCRVRDWSGERPAEPQLPLYSIATDASAIAFAQLRPRDCKLLGVGETEGVTGISTALAKSLGADDAELQWGELKQQWQQKLEHLMAEFLRGDARVEPQPRACDYCGLQALCRVEAERGAGA